MKLFNVFLLAILSLSLAGCGPSMIKQQNLVISELQQKSALEIYEKGEKEFKDKDYDEAIKTYQALNGLNPFSPYAEASQLNTIYCYYHKNEMDNTIQAIENFTRLYSTSASLDALWYLKAKAHLYNNQHKLLRFVQADLSQRDVTSFVVALQEFSAFLERFPTSTYVEKAKAKLVFIQNTLARHEYHIADYYFKQKAYLAALNRSV